MNREFTKIGVGFLGLSAWAGLHDTTSVASVVIGSLCLATLVTIFACYFTLRIRREVRAVKEDNREARARRAAGKRE
ncbi:MULTISPECIES: hypothetical protein [unclassified Streptomyces]|uniref:hypothetical protein n=1 Tax=unclassified Streptomyces TaxID=2593676 RepID=UPI00117ED8D2|nr:hypothetical protein [Streptomyces sp. Ru87]